MIATLWAWFDDFYNRISLEHKQIAKGVITVALFALLGKSVAAIKEMVLAWRYGISVTVDAYLFTFNLAQWPVALFYGVISAVLIPLIAEGKQRDPEGITRFRAEILGGTLVVAIGFGFVAWKTLPILVQQSWIGLNLRQQTLAAQFAPWFAWIIPFGMVYALLAAWTMSENRHINTLVDSLPALTLLIAILLMDEKTLRPLILGVLIGFILQPAFLAFSLNRHRALVAPAWGFHSPWWQRFWMAFAAMLVGQFLQSLTGIADQFFAARLGSGELATLGYSNRILALINAIGAMAIGRGVLPVLSRTYAQGRPVRRSAVQWATLSFALGGLAAILGILLAPDIVRLLFQRGAFSEQDTYRVANVLRVAFLQLPIYLGGLVLVYALLSQGKQYFVAILAGTNLIVKILAGWFLVIYLQKGLQGLMLSATMVYLSSFLGALIFLYREHFRRFL